MITRNEKGQFSKKNPFDKNKHEIYYNLINSLLAGAMVFVGALADGKLSGHEILASLGAAGVVALIKFRDYWNTQKNEYVSNLFTWV